MKKLMMAVAAVCAAACVQAAQFDWEVASDGAYADDATYYVVSGDGAGAALASILTTSGVDDFTAALDDYTWAGGTKLSSGVAFNTLKNITGNEATVFFMNDGLTGGKSFGYITYDSTPYQYAEPSPAPDTLYMYGSDYGNEEYASSWGTGTIATSIPEPTSGLLLLLGVAGLALRRRRA